MLCNRSFKLYKHNKKPLHNPRSHTIKHLEHQLKMLVYRGEFS